MHHFWTLFKWDITLLNRNRLFMIAAVVTLLYVGIFYLLKPLGDLTNILIVLIFNDPVVTGFLFAGVLWLFDKNQHTLQAIAVLPLEPRLYLLSKAVVLSLLATVIAFVMAIATKGLNFNGLHLFVSAFFSTFIFSYIGFCIGAIAKNFNQFLLYAIPILILTGAPFLILFGIGNVAYFLPLPSAGGIALLQASFEPKGLTYNLLMYVHLIAWSFIIWFFTNRITIRHFL